jgi:ferritin-like metal-binding protein YciE
MPNLKVLFLNELADMYDAEQQIVKALPKLADAATCDKLKRAFVSHLAETKEQVVQIRQVFKAFGEKPRRRKCAATTGLLREGAKIAGENKGASTINAALISAGKKIEHYEMASYGCLHEWAMLLQNETAARIIEEILAQEKNCDKTLDDLAVEKNREALDADGEGSGNDRAGKTIHRKPRKKSGKM